MHIKGIHNKYDYPGHYSSRYYPDTTFLIHYFRLQVSKGEVVPIQLGPLNDGLNFSRKKIENLFIILFETEWRKINVAGFCGQCNELSGSIKGLRKYF